MLTLKHIPAEIYLVALDIMGEDRPTDPKDAERVYSSAAARIDYRMPLVSQAGRDLGQLDSFSVALAMYTAISGPFGEGGEFAGVNGYRVE